MSSEKKVTFLFLLLFVVIISCVYFHAEDILNKKTANQPTSNSLETETTLNNEVTNTTKSVETLTKIEETTATIPQVTKTEPIQTIENNVIEQQKEPEPVIETKPIKILKTKPLISIDKDKYIRVDGEKYIQDLSLSAQTLQLKINDLLAKNPIIFKRASTEILRKSEKTVDTIARILKDNKNIKVEIAGHTDAAGADDLNKMVSTKRANKIKLLISSYGISDKRLIARGYGEDIPIVENNQYGYSLVNRRVEFNIVEE